MGNLAPIRHCGANSNPIATITLFCASCNIYWPPQDISKCSLHHVNDNSMCLHDNAVCVQRSPTKRKPQHKSRQKQQQQQQQLPHRSNTMITTIAHNATRCMCYIAPLYNATWSLFLEEGPMQHEVVVLNIIATTNSTHISPPPTPKQITIILLHPIYTSH